ncbi:MAG TPA: ABC transporter ATP-binding protein, partial [Achromobacter sp.]|nr:ABC transporter ATP-binding protein [Achromobacter sp.]
LLRVLAGLQPATAGSLLMEGAPLTGVHPRVAVAFQDPSLLPWLSLERNVAFGLDFTHQPVLTDAQRRTRIDQAIDEVGLSH